MFGGGENFEDDMKSEEEFIFKEYTVDDSLKPLARLKRYRSSDFHLQRLNLVRGLYDTVHEIGIKRCIKEKVTEMIQQFLNDNEHSVRRELAEQLYPIAVFYLENGSYENGYKNLLKVFIPFTFELVIDKKVDVSEAGTRALVQIANLVHPDNVEQELFVTIKNLCRNTVNSRTTGEEHRIAAAKLLNELAPIFGEELCCSKVVPELIHLSRDPSLSVRKAVAQSLDKICPIVGRSITVERILPFYLGLCQDDIWGVRKACVESMCVISEHVTPKERIQQLTPLFTQFCSDSSRWVKIEMFRQLGRFISTFKKDQFDIKSTEEDNIDEEIIPFDSKSESESSVSGMGRNRRINLREHANRKKRLREAKERHRIRKTKEEVIPRLLIKYFNDMAFQSEQSDTDLVEFCAYNFPAVVEAVGKKGWPMLEKSYKYLVKDMQWKVRKTLSWSLVRIAKILLGEEEEEKKGLNKKGKAKKKKTSNEEDVEEDFDFDERSEYFSQIDEVDHLEDSDYYTKAVEAHTNEFRKRKKNLRKTATPKGKGKDEKSPKKTEKVVKKKVLAREHDPSTLRPHEMVLIQSAHSFLRDIDDVKLGIISSITKFMNLITERKREEFLSLICQILKDVENWRIKQKVAEQLSDFLELFGTTGRSKSKQSKHFFARKKIVKLYIQLMKDDFAIIRDSTAKETGNILNQLVKCSDEENYKDVMVFVCELAVDSKGKGNWISRMLFLTVCKYLVRQISGEIFEKNFLGLLLKLAAVDKCVNVQILAAKILCEEISQTEQWKNDHRVIKTINKLKDHDDPDVSFTANQTKVSFNSALQNYDITQLILAKEFPEDRLSRFSSDNSIKMKKKASQASMRSRKSRN